MGVRNLTRWVNSNCSFDHTAIHKTHIREYAGKCIVVDASIYMYKFKQDMQLYENFYQMVMMFREFNCTLLFVFDGKPPVEKNTTISERRTVRDDERSNAQSISLEIQKLKDDRAELRDAMQMSLTLESEYGDKIKRLETKLYHAKRASTRIGRYDVTTVKKMLDILKVPWLHPVNGEADDLCYEMVNKKVAWACMTEDSDLFVKGCDRVIMNFDLNELTCTLYTMKGILSCVKLTQSQFTEGCVLAGTDYKKGVMGIDNAMRTKIRESNNNRESRETRSFRETRNKGKRSASPSRSPKHKPPLYTIPQHGNRTTTSSPSPPPSPPILDNPIFPIQLYQNEFDKNGDCCIIEFNTMNGLVAYVNKQLFECARDNRIINGGNGVATMEKIMEYMTEHHGFVYVDI